MMISVMQTDGRLSQGWPANPSTWVNGSKRSCLGICQLLFSASKNLLK